MIFRSSLIFVFFILTLVTWSQVKLDTLGVTDFNTKIPGTESYISLFTEKTADILNSSGRVFLVDLTSDKSVNNVIRRAQENYKGNWIDDRAKINPKKIIVGEINVLKFIKSLSSTNPGYKSNIQFIIKLIETESSKILDSYEVSGQSSGISITQEKALQDAISQMSNEISNWALKVFPLYADLVKIKKENNKSIEEVIISIGTNQKVQNGSYFDIIYFDNSFNPPLPEIIGTGEISEILNENYSVLKITDGDKTKLKKLLSNINSNVKFKSKF